MSPVLSVISIATTSIVVIDKLITSIVVVSVYGSKQFYCTGLENSRNGRKKIASLGTG
jgi:hypothetical protein